MNFSEFMEDVTVLSVLQEWKTIRQNYEQYISEVPAGVYGTDAPENQLVSLDDFQKALEGAYNVFCKNAKAHEISKIILQLFDEIKTFALNKDIATYSDGFMEFRTSIAAALCSILTESMDYGDTNQLIFQLDDMCQNHEEGYYVLDVSDLTFSYIGKDVDIDEYIYSDGDE